MMSPWRGAVIRNLDDATLQVLIDLIVLYVDLWGRKPTPQQLRAELGVTVPEQTDG